MGLCTQPNCIYGHVARRSSRPAQSTVPRPPVWIWIWSTTYVTKSTSEMDAHIRKQIGFFFSLPIFLAFAIHACVGFGSTSTPPLLCCRSASPVTRSKQLCYFPLRYMPFKHLIIYFPPLLPRDYVPLRCLMLPQIVPYLPSLCKAYTGKVSFLSNLYMCIFGM